MLVAAGAMLGDLDKNVSILFLIAIRFSNPCFAAAYALCLAMHSSYFNRRMSVLLKSSTRISMSTLLTAHILVLLVLALTLATEQ